MADNLVTKKYGKGPVLYVLVSTLILALAGLLQRAAADNTDTYFYFAQALTFILGILHVYCLYRFIPQLDPGSFWYGLGITLLIMLIGVLAAAIAYYYLRLDNRFLTYILPFILPYICWQVYRVFFQIPVARYKSWYYPLNAEMPDLDMIDLSKIEVVQFVFSKNPADATQTNFTAKAPLNMTLGQLFFIFINDYNDKNEQQPIQYLQSPGQPSGWLFFRKKKWFNQKEYMDPDLSFLNNAIGPNESIYAVRVN
jgi:hypothetical protein